MNCNDVDRALLADQMPSRLPPQVREHLRECRRCREFLRAINAPARAELPSSITLRQIQQAIAADLRPVRPVAPKRYVFVALVAIVISVVAVAVHRFGAHGIAVMHPLQADAILSALAISTGLLAYSLGRQMIPGSRHRISPKLLPVGILTALICMIAVLFPFQHERTFWASAWRCFRAGTPIAAFAAAPFWLVLRRGAVLYPAITGATTGLLAGLAGTSLLEIHCPNMDAWHILVSHAGVAVLGAIVGLVCGLVADVGATSLAARHPR